MTHHNLCFVSLGCPKNLVDTEGMLGLAESLGHRLVSDPEQADVLVVNTCAFIDEAKEESIETILEMARIKEEGHPTKLVVTGCLAQRYGEELAEELPEVDHFLGTTDFPRLAQILSGEPTQRVQVQKPAALDWSILPRLRATPPWMAYLKISEGCSSGCSFCIIPKLRGKQQSRNAEEILAEARRFLDEGTRELLVVGQNTTDYAKDWTNSQENLAGLLRQLDALGGDHWIRLHYGYPASITDELLETIRDATHIVPYLDVPIQHIDSAVLKGMNRRDDEQSTRRMLERIRTLLPGVALRTSVIVGFPGETDEAFNRLLDVVQESHFDRLGAFTFSPQEGTPAARLPHPVAEEVVAERVQRLMEAQAAVSQARLSRFVGQKLRVLIEGESEEHELLSQGRFFGQAPEIDGVVHVTQARLSPGDFVTVEITQAQEHDLVGDVVEES